MLFTKFEDNDAVLTADKIILEYPGDGDSYQDDDDPEDDDWSDIDDEDFEDIAEDDDELQQIKSDNNILDPDDDDHLPDEND